MIQKFTHDDLVGSALKHWGEGKLVADQPTSSISGKRIRAFEGKIDNCGIWEASPGHFVREVKAAEFMYIISGECSFTPQDGETIDIVAGDCLFFPEQTNGVWHIRQPTRKVYLMI